MFILISISQILMSQQGNNKQMTQYFQPPKFRNLISFGKSKESYEDISDKQYDGDGLNVRLVDSCQFDMEKSFSDLGLEIVNSTQRSMQNSCHFNVNKSILGERIKGFIRTVRQQIFKLQKDVKNLRVIQQKFFSMFNINEIIQQLKSNKIILVGEGSQNCSQSLSLSRNQNDKLDYIKKVLQSTSYSVEFKNNMSHGELMKDIEQLKIEKDSQNNQILKLKSQIQNLKNLLQKKQNYYNDKLKQKELQWERRLNQILKDYQSTSNKKVITQSKSCKRLMQNRIRVAAQHAEPYSKKDKSQDRYNLQNHGAFYTLRSSKQKQKRINSKTKVANLQNSFETKIEGSAEFYQKMKYIQLRCKRSNDSSLIKASEKIKLLEQNVRKQIQKMKKN